MLSFPVHVPTTLLFLGLALASPTASANTPTRTSTSIVDVELVEANKGSEQRAVFSVPVGGELEAWVRGGDDPRFCRVRVEPVGEGSELEVNLRCGVNVQAPTNLQMKARRALRAGKTTVIGQLSRPDGRTVEVRAKLR